MTRLRLDHRLLPLTGLSLLAAPLACSDDSGTTTTITLTTSETGDGDPGDGDPGDGDPGDGDPGDGDPGDGDGDPGDGDPGDGDGDPMGECGNGVVEANEECDDGNPVDSDACTSECLDAVCGDGVVWAGMEECDVGNETMFCDGDCTYAMCGDGYHNMLSEECDDGNADSNDGCVGPCLLAACGDGFLYEGVEECDDADMVDNNDCRNDCSIPYCGDGFIWDDGAGVEECDDSNMDETDACNGECQNSFCGDGVIWAGMETCDDGNMDNNDACPACEPAYCGDGFWWEGVEECDDGNQDDNDWCHNDCTSDLYFPVGVQTNVPSQNMAGWTMCWSTTYNQSGANIANILNQSCTGQLLAMACRPVGQQDYTVMAAGQRADVLFDVGNQNAGKHEANGVAWYFSDSYSWGFARGGDPVSRNSCDTNNTNPQDRLCWHSGGGNISGGWRCGATTGLNSNAQWERMLFTSN